MNHYDVLIDNNFNKFFLIYSTRTSKCLYDNLMPNISKSITNSDKTSLYKEFEELTRSSLDYEIVVNKQTPKGF